MAEKNERVTQSQHGDEEQQARSQSFPDLDLKKDLVTVDAGFSADQVVAQMDEREATRIIRKLDYRIVPLLSLLYL